MGGRYLIGVSAEHREHAGVAAGDTVDVVVELDTEPRVVAVPPDFARALKRDADAKRVVVEGSRHRHATDDVVPDHGEFRQRRLRLDHRPARRQHRGDRRRHQHD